MIDTLKLSKRLQGASMPKDQAEAFAEGLAEAIKEDLVTNERLDGSLARLELRLVLWIIGTSVAIGGVEIGTAIFLHKQTIELLQHWRP
jgi:hypothetical protein